jgi:hyperosmotically inducible periplasmic protein
MLCITGAVALACSKDKPAQSAYESQRPVDEAPLTPASSDRTDHARTDHAGMDHSGMDRSDATSSSPSESGRTTVSPDTSSTPDTIPPRGSDNSSATAPDNTARNERDRSGNAVTPMDQGNGQSDLDITQKIRQAVMGNSSLSFTAKNVKIVTQSGKVTLRGTVPTYEERLAVEEAARSVAGKNNVQSEIEVKK